MDGFKTRIKLWDKEKKIILPSVPLYKCDFFNVDTYKYIPLFSTGQEINNQDLFQGDVVKSWIHKDVPMFHAVEWSEKLSGWFMWNMKDVARKGDGSIQLWVYLKNAINTKITGTIHEYPELLTTGI